MNGRCCRRHRFPSKRFHKMKNANRDFAKLDKNFHSPAMRWLGLILVLVCAASVWGDIPIPYDKEHSNYGDFKAAAA